MEFDKVYKYTKDLNVLYVEDDEQLLEETNDVLEDFFLNVHTAINGKIALAKYEEFFRVNNIYYDLIITDINMPIMDGIGLIKEVKSLNENQSIIVVSAYNESARLIDLIQLGISNFVMKPMESSRLMDMLLNVSRQEYNKKELRKSRIELENMNKQLDLKVQEQAKEILFTQKISIETIANMIESYDDDTGTHVKRIESYTQLMIDRLTGSNESQKHLRDNIAFASILHDLGKLMIPKNILTKNGKLSPDEFEKIKEHARLGGEVLEKANTSFVNTFNKDSYLKIASDIAMYHHEKWDGEGYPKGLKGIEIPLSARIVSIVDVYDALRSRRVYKDGFTHEKAIDIITAERGKGFDPELVDLFIELNKEFDEIFNNLS